MKPLITRYYRGRMTDVIILALLVFALSGCTNDKTAILGRWEQTGCEYKSERSMRLTSYMDEMEFLKGDIVILRNSLPWSYSFPQDGWLNIGEKTGGGETYQYEITKDSLTLRQGEDYCVYQRMGSAATAAAWPGALAWALIILLAAGVAGVLIIRRRGKPQGAAPAGDAAPARPVAQAFCMHCGQPVQAGSRFCLHCGKSLS